MATHSAAAPSPDTSSPLAPGPGVVSPEAPSRQSAARRPNEHPAHSTSGVLILVLGIAFALAALGLIIEAHTFSGTAALVVGGAIGALALAAAFTLSGLTPVTVGEARVVQLFGRYSGTIREPGLRWVNPFTKRRRVSIRIAAVVVWQVDDTALALYAVDDFTQFVATQTETAVRHIATSYPYDSGD